MQPYEEHHHLFTRCRALENEIPVILCNRLGTEGNLTFCGDSMVIDAIGKVHLSMKEEEGGQDSRTPHSANTRSENELYEK